MRTLRLAAARPLGRLTPAVVLAAVIPLAAACTTAGDASVAVRSTDTECKADDTSLDAGVTEFQVTNAGSQVTEVYILRPNGTIVSERENIGPGTRANLTVELDAGDYSLRCRASDSGKGVVSAFTVSGDATTAEDPRLTAAMASYRTYVETQANDSLQKTKQLRDAVKAGDIATVKELYAPSRYGWESVEPIAESFGDLDPRVDLREADLEAGQKWTGWHVIEKAAWQTGSLDEMAPYADHLVADLEELIDRVRKVEMSPTSMANGAKELLDEVATGKVTGEEEAFSHTDFVDMQANVDGAREVYTLLLPVVKEREPELVTQIDAGFALVDKRLQTLRTGPGVADFQPYTVLDDAGRQALAADVNALAEPLSHLAAAVAPAEK